MNFTEFGFDDDLLDGIDAMGYHTATPVQEQVIPPHSCRKRYYRCRTDRHW